MYRVYSLSLFHKVIYENASIEKGGKSLATVHKTAQVVVGIAFKLYTPPCTVSV